MRDRCPEPLELLALIEAGPDASLEAHLSACPRCAALAASFRAFEAAEPGSGADDEDAERRLTGAVLAALDEGPARSEPAPSSPPLRWLWAPAAIAATLLLVVGGWQLVEPWRSAKSPSGSYRGESRSALQLSDPMARADGALLLAWRSAGPEGDIRYEISILGADLGERARREVSADTTIALDRNELRRLAASGEPLYWEVVARRGGRELLRSEIVTLELERP